VRDALRVDEVVEHIRDELVILPEEDFDEILKMGVKVVDAHMDWLRNRLLKVWSV